MDGTQSSFRGISAILLWISATAVVAPVERGFAQVVEPREVAAFSLDDPVTTTIDESDFPVREPAIAAGSTRAMSVHMTLLADNKVEIGYAIAEVQTGGDWLWVEEGIIDRYAFDDVDGLTDPTIAFDAISGDFLVCAMPRDQGRIALARWDAASQSFGQWEVIFEDGENFDQPRIVPGLVNVALGPMGNSEFYITWRGPSDRLMYLHSVDNGFSWIGGLALSDVNNSTSYINGVVNGIRPGVTGSNPLYASYFDAFDGGSSFNLVKGVDITTGSHAGEVQFERLLDTSDKPIAIPFNLHRGLLHEAVPGPNGVGNSVSGYGVSVLVDPTNSNRLFVVYHDTASNPVLDKDVNIYTRVLTRNSSTNRWTVGERLLVADDSLPLVQTDQFLPEVDFDTAGGIHVTY